MIDLNDMAKIFMLDPRATYSFVKNIYIKFLFIIPDDEQAKNRKEINYAIASDIYPYRDDSNNSFNNYSYADIRKYHYYLTYLANVTALSTYVNEIGSKLVNNDPIDVIVKYVPEIHAAKYREYIPDDDELFLPKNILDILFEFYNLSGVIQTYANSMIKYQNIIRSLMTTYYFCPYSYLDYNNINIHKIKLPFSSFSPAAITSLRKEESTYNMLNRKSFFQIISNHLTSYNYKKELIAYYTPSLYNFILSCSNLVFLINNVLLSEDPIVVYTNLSNMVSLVLEINHFAYNHEIAYFLSGMLNAKLEKSNI